MISPVTYAELAPVFDGDAARQELFLYRASCKTYVAAVSNRRERSLESSATGFCKRLYHLQVSCSEAWTHAETQAAHAAWHRYVQSRRLQRIAKRPMADILIGAFAGRFEGLLTRNENDFRTVFQTLPILVP